jgi:hypothetical protein
MDFKRIVKLIRDAEDPENDAYRYWLNRPRAAASHWLTPDQIRAVLGKVTPKPGSAITGGFDGSENDDHTALMGCTEDGKLFTVGLWTPEGDDLGWREEVMEAVAWMFSTFDVVRFYGDPAWWTAEMGNWAAEHGSPPVAEFWTGGRSEARMAIATGALHTAIRQKATLIDPHPLQTEEIFVDGRTLLQWHFENARKRKIRIRRDEDKPAEDANLIRKERRGSPLKIDSATSSILAKRAHDDAVKKGEFEERNKTYGRAAWQEGSEGQRRKKKTPKSEYIPCVSCGKPIHPDLHKPDAEEKGRCLKCRLSEGG